MKLQDVLLKAMAKKITWMDAAEIAGGTDRTMRRIRERYQQFGYTGLFDQRRGKRSIHRIPMETAEEVLRLYREVYFDLNMRHFHEKLREEHDIPLSYSWVKQALPGAGLVPKRRKRGPHRRRRPRRPTAGMLLHIDGSKHRWLQDDRYYDDRDSGRCHQRDLLRQMRLVLSSSGVPTYISARRCYLRTVRSGGTGPQPAPTGRAVERWQPLPTRKRCRIPPSTDGAASRTGDS